MFRGMNAAPVQHFRTSRALFGSGYTMADDIDEATMTSYLERDYVESRVMHFMKEFEQVDNDKVTPTAHFIHDLGFDSLDTVEIVIGLEEDFMITIPDEVADKMESVDAAVNYIVTVPNALGED